jgi:hypothetical protein
LGSFRAKPSGDGRWTLFLLRLAPLLFLLALLAGGFFALFLLMCVVWLCHSASGWLKLLAEPSGIGASLLVPREGSADEQAVPDRQTCLQRRTAAFDNSAGRMATAVTLSLPSPRSIPNRTGMVTGKLEQVAVVENRMPAQVNASWLCVTPTAAAATMQSGSFTYSTGVGATFPQVVPTSG